MPETKYCPACDKSYPNMADLRIHIKKAQNEGDANHIDIALLEGWDETPLTAD